MAELLIRFVIGGAVVSVFALMGDMLKPKTFAGLFGAAPSVALATLGLTSHSKGAVYTSIEARSMMIGAVAFVVYACAVSAIMMRFKPAAVWVSLSLLLGWLAVALGVWRVVLG
jgi:Protein of unknown function (DUF3147)